MSGCVVSARQDEARISKKQMKLGPNLTGGGEREKLREREDEMDRLRRRGAVDHIVTISYG